MGGLLGAERKPKELAPVEKPVRKCLSNAPKHRDQEVDDEHDDAGGFVSFLTC
jgi:hypothetical protein